MSFRPADDFTSDELGLNSSVFTNVGQTADIKDDSEDTLVEAQEEPIEIPRGSDDNSGEDKKKLFLGGLSWETKEPQLKAYFERFGEVENINLKLDPVTGRSRCFAFIVFKEPSSVDKVLSSGDHAINSKKIDVKRARAKPGKIFVGGLEPELSEEVIRSHFSQFGNVLECEMPFDKTKNQRKNFCFITFEREETMKELLKSSKQRIEGVEVDVKKATPRFGNRAGYGMGDGYGYMDYYHGYPEYYGWGGGYDSSRGYSYGYEAGDSGEGGGGKMFGPKGGNRANPY